MENDKGKRIVIYNEKLYPFKYVYKHIFPFMLE